MSTYFSHCSFLFNQYDLAFQIVEFRGPKIWHTPEAQSGLPVRTLLSILKIVFHKVKDISSEGFIDADRGKFNHQFTSLRT